jgi:hypothetical protein
MLDEYEDFDEWGPSPTLELTQKSIDFNLLMWKAGARYDVVLWERRGDADRMLKLDSTNDYEYAKYLFACHMNELEMYT